jgi:hypothetical protein
MGRGRAKAIQKKIARDLKYSSGGTDLERLRAELASGTSESAHTASDDEDDDEFAPYVADEDDEDE